MRQGWGGWYCRKNRKIQQIGANRSPHLVEIGLQPDKGVDESPH
jgi:hypothetical protein